MNEAIERRNEQHERDKEALEHFKKAMTEWMPEPGDEWAPKGRALWLQAAASFFDLIYVGGPEKIKIVVVDDENSLDQGRPKQ